jgi:hypothetical protein
LENTGDTDTLQKLALLVSLFSHSKASLKKSPLR